MDLVTRTDADYPPTKESLNKIKKQTALIKHILSSVPFTFVAGGAARDHFEHYPAKDIDVYCVDQNSADEVLGLFEEQGMDVKVLFDISGARSTDGSPYDSVQSYVSLILEATVTYNGSRFILNVMVLRDQPSITDLKTTPQVFYSDVIVGTVSYFPVHVSRKVYVMAGSSLFLVPFNNSLYLYNNPALNDKRSQQYCNRIREEYTKRLSVSRTKADEGFYASALFKQPGRLSALRTFERVGIIDRFGTIFRGGQNLKQQPPAYVIGSRGLPIKLPHKSVFSKELWVEVPDRIWVNRRPSGAPSFVTQSRVQNPAQVRFFERVIMNTEFDVLNRQLLQEEVSIAIRERLHFVQTENERNQPSQGSIAPTDLQIVRSGVEFF